MSSIKIKVTQDLSEKVIRKLNLIMKRQEQINADQKSIIERLEKIEDDEKDRETLGIMIDKMRKQVKKFV